MKITDLKPCLECLLIACIVLNLFLFTIDFTQYRITFIFSQIDHIICLFIDKIVNNNPY